MTDTGDGDSVANPGASNPRPSSFALGKGALAGRISLNSPPPGRLTSLRSRDLTLGGFKKKTFVPNVHSVRKSKDELREETRTPPKKEKREDRQRESRRRRERPQVIQSHSIFEQGPADTIRKTGSWGNTDLSDCGPSLVTKCVKKEKKVTQEDESEILQKLQRDDFLDDPGLKNDVRQRPIQLPLYQSSSFLLESSASCKEKTVTESRAPVGLGCVGPQQPAVGELFQKLSLSDQEELLFIQLPDTIPGQPASTSTETSAKKDNKPDDKNPSKLKTQEPTGKESAPVLADFSEGLIGKLQIRKSGKVQLVLGDIKLDVSEGAAFSFLQQLVSVRLSDGLTGDMSVLGNVQHKLVCSPDFQTLLQGVKRPSGSSSGKS
ncbi:DNA-directed RNA polymerase III subunit RPC4 [Alosa sapidissima]|uniref:DNA-directed RNA polymerase III subunit RPC4 n=1 Tax=Alosa sapidissima TaxID=34773 RepID=UPI001C09A076|nr:DNA-directed RNA polymerase III subunit RPC4 [Alosa sapidissima]XP_041938067.1 DNA-directed RNA polymerase III subunit RPC4 [Alosa sapidissima]XP_041938068.1 DNA-directed RNA polymerase III subunit RPC4 [Alosa sapidissima]